jgi:DNA helicase II / ATP-dependent DNA helicase PcrA
MGSRNRIVIAAAGSRKTTHIVEESLQSNDRILIVTYTNENVNQIRGYFFEKAGRIPPNVTVQTWFSFLLADAARPYQNILYSKSRLRAFCFVQGRSAIYVPKTEVARYYIHNGDEIYSDKISEFTIKCNDLTKGMPLKRIEKIYDRIYVDEVQDFAGYDLDLLACLMGSGADVVAVGDPRQATYATNGSPRNKQYRGPSLLNLFRLWNEKKLCVIEEWRDCFRSNQAICDFADALYPSMSSTISRSTVKTDHDGVFAIRSYMIREYVKQYHPVILRWSNDVDSLGFNAYNFGLTKGQTFDRVLILPTKQMREFLRNGSASFAAMTRAKLYVGITRARHSVTFVCDDPVRRSGISQLAPSEADYGPLFDL